MKTINIIENWQTIKNHFRDSFSSNLHVSIASVDELFQPNITPIGSFFLTKNQKGFYFEILTSKLPKNAQLNKKVCVMAVNSGKWFWLKSLFTGKFGKYPAIRLYGEMGERRKATQKEIDRFNRRIKFFKLSKGHKLLWSDLTYVREIHFKEVESVNIGKMTAELI